MTILSPGQQRVMDELLPITKIAVDGTRDGMTLLPRTSTIILGPSGSGKTHLAKIISVRASVPVLVINVATWILLSHRAEPSTWATIVEFLGELKTGGVIIADELDKLNSGGGGEYSNYLKMEIFALLDGSIPTSIAMPTRPDYHGTSIPWETPPPTWERDELSQLLRERVMIIGCGAWQSAWRSNANQLGFSSGPATAPEPPTRAQILSSIDAELRQRFRDQVAILPPMLHNDYVTVAKQLASQIPAEAREAWRLHLGTAIQAAMAGTLGMRVFEELLLRALVLARQPKTQNIEEPQKPELTIAGPPM